MIARLDRSFCALNGAIVGLLLAAMLGLVFANIVSRSFFSLSFGWIEEVSRYLMIWIVFLGAGLALREGMHVAVTLVVDLAKRTKPALKWIAFLIALAFFVGLVWFGLKYALFAWRQRSAMLHLPMGMIYLAVPIGSAMAILHLLLSLRDEPSEPQGTLS